VESAFTAVGFGTILWSLYRTEESEPPANAETGVDVEPCLGLGARTPPESFRRRG